MTLEPKICTFVKTGKGRRQVPPFTSTDFKCPDCGGTKHLAITVDGAERDGPNIWICLDRICCHLECDKIPKECQGSRKQKRALEWPEFCRINKLGDLLHDVAFEKMNQSQGKIEYLQGFAKKPQGMILMQGSVGTGKTYASLALCELFTRTSPHCMFMTEHGLYDSWIRAFNEPESHFLSKVYNTHLLVVDEFGFSDTSTKFLNFFMDLISRRMQFSHLGTVVTTNLDEPERFKKYGAAITDRFRTAQVFEFSGESRRKRTL